MNRPVVACLQILAIRKTNVRIVVVKHWQKGEARDLNSKVRERVWGQFCDSFIPADVLV